MVELIRKNLLLHKQVLYCATPALAIYLCWFASKIDSINVYITFVCMVAGVLPMVLIPREDVFCSGPFNCSLPVTRRQVVLAKYVISWAISLVLTVIGILLLLIFVTEGLIETWSVSTVSRVLFMLTVGLGVALPFALRFGWLGLTVVGVGMQILGIVAYLIVKTFPPSRRLLDAFAANSDRIEQLHSRLGDPLFLAAAMVVLVVFNLVSCKIAVALFEQKELC